MFYCVTTRDRQVIHLWLPLFWKDHPTQIGQIIFHVPHVLGTASLEGCETLESRDTPCLETAPSEMIASRESVEI